MELLGIILDSLLIVLVIILIFLAIKALDTLTKVDAILDSTKEKLDSLNNAFKLVDTVTDKLNIVTDTIVSSVVAFIGNIFKKKKEDDIDE